MPDIGIFVGSKKQFFRRPYFIQELIKRWMDFGLSVGIAENIDEMTAVDLAAVLHYDQTRLPQDVGTARAGSPPILNGRLLDISKRKVSGQIVDRDSGYDGPVIVKTDRNCGGLPDLEVLGQQSRVWRPAVWALRKLPWFVSGVLDPGSYRIYPSLSHVPWAVRHNKNLVIEKFLPERQGEFYCLRQYLFCGSRELNTLLLGRKPVVKAHDAVWREEVPDVPESLRAVRRAFGVDYGRFDYVIAGDSVVLFDINKTPSYDPSRVTVPFARMAETLAPGIFDFIDRRDDNGEAQKTVLTA